MSNLAAILWQEGDREEAYALQQQVIEMQRSVRGDSDEATLAAMAVLETMERGAGFPNP
jgi:tetratricopeptide repeat protein